MFGARSHDFVVLSTVPAGPVLVHSSTKRRGIVMVAPHWELIHGAVASLSQAPIVVHRFEELLAA